MFMDHKDSEMMFINLSSVELELTVFGTSSGNIKETLDINGGNYHLFVEAGRMISWSIFPFENIRHERSMNGIKSYIIYFDE